MRTAGITNISQTGKYINPLAADNKIACSRNNDELSVWVCVCVCGFVGRRQH